MKRILLAAMLLPLSLLAELKIAVAYPYIGAVTEEIGGEHVAVKVLAPGSWDPHFVVPRPSLIARLRTADGLIMNGGELEIGWLPALVKRANNAGIGGSGTLDLSRHVTLIEVPKTVSRAQGDVHPAGNPHFHLDPHNILPVASAIAAFLSEKDPANAAAYAQNLATFEAAWNKRLTAWDKAMETAKGKKVVQYHGIFNYFLRAYGIESVGTIEPLPGIPPSTKHTVALMKTIKAEGACCILHDVYHPTKTAEFIAAKTGIPVITLPHDIGALDSVTSLEAFYGFLVKAVTQ
jgi:zinc/manganese transport system substrate-binding protein